MSQQVALRFPGCQRCMDSEIILKEESIKGVFICTKPSLHFKYALAALQAGKFVFLEKPPCFTSDELKQLAKTGGSKCLIAFQKRYCRINHYLSRFKEPLSYNYQYLTGAYPEGDPIYELFFHAVDNIIFLFLGMKDINIFVRKAGNGLSYAINILHKNKVIGNLELSTAFSWSNFTDKIWVNYADKTVYAAYPGNLTVQKKKRRIFLYRRKIFLARIYPAVWS